MGSREVSIPQGTPEKNNQLSAQQGALTAIRTAIDQKGLDVRGIDLRSVTDIADYFVIISGTSERHVQGIVDKIRIALRETGEQANAVSGYARSEWVLMDYGDFVIHVFYEPIRQYYKFDALWETGTPMELPEDLEKQARQLRTGVYF